MLNVYLVDDDPNMCACLEELIPWEELGYNRPEIFYNALTALESLQKSKPDVVISDLIMPHMDGKELCQEIRTQYPDVDIIFLSAYEDFPSMQVALKHGVKSYILKPICSESIEQIKKNLSEIVAERRRENWWEKTFSSELIDRMHQALNERDSDYIENFFEELMLRGSDGVKRIYPFCVYLLNILLTYIHSSSYMKEFTLLQEKIQSGLQTPFPYKKAEECIDYVREHYRSVLKVLPKETKKKVLIHEINSLVAENYMDPDFGVAWIAKKVCLSPPHLSRVYAGNSGISLIEYIVAFRIKKACELLRTTFLPINQVAMQVGYSNVSYFAKLFRAQKGMSPSEYREKYHSGIQK
ncbi:MAG: response regulator [Lachnospiraceae bacterium]|nr:response regulator [Lachnospiraceae bacterium]